MTKPTLHPAREWRNDGAGWRLAVNDEVLKRAYPPIKKKEAKDGRA